MTTMTTHSLLLLLLIPAAVLATDAFFADVTGVFPNGRYCVEAKSPDNQPSGGGKAFQASFRYKCVDTISNRVLWMREQPMGKSESLGSGTDAYRFPVEGSPVDIYLNDVGQTVVWTGWRELLLILPDGTLMTKLDVLGDGLSKRPEAMEYRRLSRDVLRVK